MFKLENSLLYDSFLEIYRCPRILPTLAPEIKSFFFKPSFQIKKNFALLYFTVIIMQKTLSTELKFCYLTRAKVKKLLDFSGQCLAIGPLLLSRK